MTLGVMSFLLPLIVLRYLKGKVSLSDKLNVGLNMADISCLSCSSDHSEVNAIFPMNPHSASRLLLSLRGIVKVDSSDMGKHSTSLVYDLTLQADLMLCRGRGLVPNLGGKDGRGT